MTKIEDFEKGGGWCCRARSQQHLVKKRGSWKKSDVRAPPIENRDLSNVYNIEEEEHLKNDKNVEHLHSLSLSLSLTHTHTHTHRTCTRHWKEVCKQDKWNFSPHFLRSCQTGWTWERECVFCTCVCVWERECVRWHRQKICTSIQFREFRSFSRNKNKSFFTTLSKPHRRHKKGKLSFS